MAAGLRRVIWPLLDSGLARPVIHATYPLAEAAKAHAALERGDHIGKIVLTVADAP
jgi:NADPH2:quinone reductase